MTTLTDLLTDLKTLDPDLPLVFATDEGEIGGGYHVTELKRAHINSIDCGGRLSDWVETNLQLLDGTDRNHMKVGKFIGIASRSIDLVDGLSDGPLSFEYSPSNIGLRRYQASGITVQNDQITLRLSEDSAQCKPHAAFLTKSEGSNCCNSDPKSVSRGAN